eukprot:3004839-Pleurochrysis_carterae.AAC.1
MRRSPRVWESVDPACGECGTRGGFRNFVEGPSHSREAHLVEVAVASRLRADQPVNGLDLGSEVPEQARSNRCVKAGWGVPRSRTLLLGAMVVHVAARSVCESVRDAGLAGHERVC